MQKPVIFRAAFCFEPQAWPFPESFVIEIGDRASRSVSRESGNAAVGVHDLAEIIGLSAIELLQNSNAVGPGTSMPITDSTGKLADRPAGEMLSLDDDVVVAEAVKFA